MSLPPDALLPSHDEIAAERLAVLRATLNRLRAASNATPFRRQHTMDLLLQVHQEKGAYLGTAITVRLPDELSELIDRVVRRARTRLIGATSDPHEGC